MWEGGIWRRDEDRVGDGGHEDGVTTMRIHFHFLTFIYHVYYYSWSHDRRVFTSHMTHYESFL
jgi:hypothetical protein